MDVETDEPGDLSDLHSLKYGGWSRIPVDHIFVGTRERRVTLIESTPCVRGSLRDFLTRGKGCRRCTTYSMDITERNKEEKGCIRDHEGP